MKFLIPIIALSILTHVLFFGSPTEVVFDEVYTGNFISAYSQQRYYFDIHPPLAKLLEHYVGQVSGIDYSKTDFSKIGNSFNSSDIVVLRILPLLAGILLPILVYLICLEIGITKFSSSIVAILMSLENSLIVQSRFILTDSLLLFFGLMSILLYLKYSKDNKKRYLILLSAIFASMSFSIKWTGLAYPLLIIIIEIWRSKNIKSTLKILSIYIGAGLFVYIGSFAIHFSYFAKVGAESFWIRFLDINTDMFLLNKNLTLAHQYSSKWYSWPFMLRGVFYWQNVDMGKYIYLLGNPIVYYTATISILTSASLFIFRKFNKIHKNIAFFVIIGFLVNFLPFIFIGRVMFLYHYEAALIFSIMSIGLIFDLIKNQKTKLIVSCALIFICSITFIYFSPITYGLHLTQEQLNSRMWLSSWR